MSDKLSIFSKHNVRMHFKSGNALRQKLIQPKDKSLKSQAQWCGICSPVQWNAEKCLDLCIGETKLQQQQKDGTTQKSQLIRSRLNSLFQPSRKRGSTFKSNNVHILDRNSHLEIFKRNSALVDIVENMLGSSVPNTHTGNGKEIRFGILKPSWYWEHESHLCNLLGKAKCALRVGGGRHEDL